MSDQTCFQCDKEIVMGESVVFVTESNELKHHGQYMGCGMIQSSLEGFVISSDYFDFLSSFLDEDEIDQVNLVTVYCCLCNQ